MTSWQEVMTITVSSYFLDCHHFTPENLVCTEGGTRCKMAKEHDNVDLSHVALRIWEVIAKRLLRRRLSVWALFGTALSLWWNQLKLMLFITNWLKLSVFAVGMQVDSIFGEWICEMRHYFYNHLMRKRHLAPSEKRFNQSNALLFIYSSTFTINIMLIGRLSSLLHTPRENPCCEIHRIRRVPILRIACSLSDV